MTQTESDKNNDRDDAKLERLALIRERYRKLVLEPRKQIEYELQTEDDDDLDAASYNV